MHLLQEMKVMEHYKFRLKSAMLTMCHANNLNTRTLDGLTLARKRIVIHEEIGRGAFGVVHVAQLKALETPDRTQLTHRAVAVKLCKENCPVEEHVKLLLEAVMLAASVHLNIVRLIGVICDRKPAFMVLEYLQNGDLKTFLRNHRLGLKRSALLSLSRAHTPLHPASAPGSAAIPSTEEPPYTDGMPPLLSLSPRSEESLGPLGELAAANRFASLTLASPTEEAPYTDGMPPLLLNPQAQTGGIGLETITVRLLLGVLDQVARAFSFLEQRKIVHRDLAARNIFVGATLEKVKVGDFGLGSLLFFSFFELCF
jgi:tRNA A-37 threonylcarbamoyl transferase component Bud32